MATYISVLGLPYITKYHKVSGLINRHLLPYRSGDQKSEFKISAGLVPSENFERESALFPSRIGWLQIGMFLSS